MKYIVSKTYDVVTPESAAEGDVADSGFEFESKEMDLEDVMREVEELGSYENLQDAPVSQSLYAADGHTNYKTGEETRYALHIDGSEEDMQLLVDILEGRKKMPEEGSLEHQADELLKMFSKQVSIDEVVAQEEPKEVEIGGLTFTYGGRELSVSEDDLLFIWDVNSIGDRHSYMLFDIQDENGESVTEAVMESGEKFKKLTRQLAAKGARDPKALAAWIGREKLGKEAFQKKAAAGRKAKVGEVKENLVHAEYDNDYLKELDKLSNDELMAQYKSAMQMYKDQVSKGNEKSFIAQDAKRDLKHIRKVARDGGLKLESTELAVTVGGKTYGYALTEAAETGDDDTVIGSYERHALEPMLKKLSAHPAKLIKKIESDDGEQVVKVMRVTHPTHKSMIGIHLEDPSQSEIDDAVEKAFRDGFEYIWVHIPQKLNQSIHEAAVNESWLPSTLKDEHQDLVAEVSNKIGYDVEVAQAFAVALLEDVNAHEEAAKVNAALTQVEESKQLKEAYEVLIKDKEAAIECLEYVLSTTKKDYFEQCKAQGWDCEDINNPHIYAVACKAFGDPVVESKQLKEEAEETEKELTKKLQEKQKKIRDLIPSVVSAVNDIRTPDPDSVKYEIKQSDFKKDLKIALMKLDSVEKKLEEIKAQSLKESVEKETIKSKQLKEEQQSKLDFSKMSQAELLDAKERLLGIKKDYGELTPEEEQELEDIEFELDDIFQARDEADREGLDEASEEDEMKQLDKMQAELQALYKSDKPEDAAKAKELQPKVDALFKKLYSVESKPLGEALGDGPAVYVGTYGKYAGGSIAGKWLNLEDYADLDEFIQAAKELHKDEEDPELMFQDFQGFPERYYSESSINPKVWEWLELDEGDRELLEVYIDEVNDEDATIDQARDRYMGKFDSERDWAMEFIDEAGGLSPEQAANYIYVDDVTARTIGIEEADARLEDMSDEDAVEEAGMTDEYETAMDAEDAAAAEQIVSKARDEVSSKISDEVEEVIKKDAVGYFVDELGAYTEEELASQSFVSIDYDAYARDARLGGDVSFVRKDGDVWVFANY